MICLNCEREFEPRRRTAKYCSDKCRVYFNRNNSVTDSVIEKPLSTTNSVTNEVDSVTRNDSVTEPFALCSKHGGYKISCGCK